jgi:hypothetical protein
LNMPKFVICPEFIGIIPHLSLPLRRRVPTC